MADWWGTSGGFQQQTTQTPGQQQNFNQLLSGLGAPQGAGMEWLQNMLAGGEGAFDAYEAPFKRQFEQETIPGIAERFAGMGSGGAQSSSAMQQTMGQAGTELSQNLASLRGNLQQNAMGLLQGMMGQSYQPTFENVFMQPTQGIIPGMIQGAGAGASQAAGMYGGMQGMKAMGIF